MKKITAAIAGIFSGLYSAIFGKKDVPVVDIPTVDISTETVDHVLTIVSNIKKFVENPTVLVIADLFPGTIDNTILKLIDTALLPVAAGLTFVKAWLTNDQVASREKMLTDILAKVRLSDDADKDAFYHTLAARLIVVAADGKVTWSEAVSVVEIYFKNFFTIK